MTLSSCGVNQQKAVTALENAGYHDVRVGSMAMFGCGFGDDFASNFTAISNATNNVVSGTLCDGVLTNLTIRFD